MKVLAYSLMVFGSFGFVFLYYFLGRFFDHVAYNYFHWDEHPAIFRWLWPLFIPFSITILFIDFNREFFTDMYSMLRDGKR